MEALASEGVPEVEGDRDVEVRGESVAEVWDDRGTEVVSITRKMTF